MILARHLSRLYLHYSIYNPRGRTLRDDILPMDIHPLSVGKLTLSPLTQTVKDKDLVCGGGGGKGDGVGGNRAC